MTKETNNNRNNLITMMAISEDIYRTNNRILELLRGLMNNPNGITNIKRSIDSLHEKVTTLKNSDIGLPLIEEEKVVVPGPEDASPKEKNIEYKRPLQQTPSELEPEPVTEKTEAEELVMEKPPRIPPPRNPRRNKRKNTRKNTRKSALENARGRRPMKPLRERKTPTDLQD